MSAAAAVSATATAAVSGGIANVVIAATVATAEIAATSGAIATAVRREKKQQLVTGSKSHGPCTNPDTPAVLPPPQDLPVLGRQRAQDRLQGCPTAAALCLRTRQDR